MEQPLSLSNSVQSDKFLKSTSNDDQKLDFIVKNKVYDCNNRVYLMGILNITSDSFYDGNKYNTLDNAKEQVDKFIKEGVDIIDIGGESTRPGSEQISFEEELKSILPIIKYVKGEKNIIVSVDTYKSDVAEAVLNEGVEIINDISGLRFDKNMAKVIGDHNASVVLMHIKGTPRTMQQDPEYDDLMGEIIEYLEESIKIGLDNGILFNNIIIDPGIGFGKTLEHNYIIIKRLNELKVLNRPILIGLSMKSLIGKVLNNLPDDRLSGTIALNTISILKGANIIRVHDVKEHHQIIKLIEFYNKVK